MVEIVPSDYMVLVLKGLESFVSFFFFFNFLLPQKPFLNEQYLWNPVNCFKNISFSVTTLHAEGSD